MKSAVYHNYELNAGDSEDSDDLKNLLDTIKYDIGDKILLVGDIGNLGKRLRMLGVNVTILEHKDYQDVCPSLINNENCTVVRGALEYMPFDDSF